MLWGRKMTTDAELFDALKYRVEVDRYGTRKYYNADGQPHRIGGPAIALAHGATRWCLYGVEYSKHSYEQQLATLGL